MEKFKYSSGVPGYGAKGTDGSVGLGGLSIFMSDYDGITDQTTLSTRISHNQVLISSSLDNIPGYPERVYQNGDLFVDKNLSVYEIDLTQLYLYKSTNLTFESASSLFIPSILAQNGNYQRYTNNKSSSPYSIIDVNYTGLSVGNLYANPSEAYGTYTSNYGQVFVVNWDPQAGGPDKFPFVMYTSGEDQANAFVITKERYNPTFRIGNKDVNGVQRDVSMAFDFQNMEFNAKSILKANSNNFTINSSITAFNSANINLSYDSSVNIKTIDKLNGGGSSAVYLKTGDVDKGSNSGNLIFQTGQAISSSCNITGTLLLQSGDGNYNSFDGINTLRTGGIAIKTGSAIGSIIDDTLGYLAAHPAFMSNGIEIRTGIPYSYMLTTHASNWKFHGRSGDVSIGSGDTGNLEVGDVNQQFSTIAEVNPVAAFSGNVNINTGKGGNLIINQNSSIGSTSIAGESGSIKIFTGNGGNVYKGFYSTYSGIISGGNSGDIYIYCGNGGTGINGGGNGHPGSIILQCHENGTDVSNGCVGIGLSDPIHKLEVKAKWTSIRGYVDDETGAWISSSDIRYKTNIETITGAIDIVNNIRGVRYQYKESGATSLGVIAQEVKPFIPEVVSVAEIKDGEEYYGVSYDRIIPVLIEAIKEQQIIIDNLKSRIEQLEN